MKQAVDLELSVLIDTRINAYLFAPILRALNDRGIKIYIYTPSSIIMNVMNDLGNISGITYCDLDPIRLRYKNRWRAHRVAMDLFTRDDFSFQFYKRRNQITKKLPRLRRYISILSRIVPKVPNSMINSFLGKIAGFGRTNPFRTPVVLVGSLNSCAELLSSRGQKVITVMESWDHAVKEPNGYRSDLVFVWNNALKEDWIRTHGDDNVDVFFPLKLRFALELSKHLKTERPSGVTPFCVYAVAGTRRFSIDILIDLERKLIRDLARATRAAGWDLFIKPRPNGEEGEFDEILKGFDHVKVGSIAVQNADQAANYFLSDNYNRLRFAEIEGASFVINAFTTFGLDAATAGIPVLQIDLQKADGYSSSRMIYNNYHIKSYLLPHDTVMRPSGDLVNWFSNFLNAPDNNPERYAETIREWLFEGRSADQSLDYLTNRIVEELSSPKVWPRST